MNGIQRTADENITTQTVINLLKQPDLLDTLAKEVQKKAVGEKDSIKALILITIGLTKVKNKQPASSNLCLNATSGTGKDFLLDAVLQLTPKQNLFCRRRISPKSLDYSFSENKNKSWDDMITYFEDVPGHVLNGETIKTLMTAKHQKENTATIAINGKAHDLTICGKPTFLFTTAKAKLNEEMLRRVPFLMLDESEKQTEDINMRQAKEAETGKTEEMEETPLLVFGHLETAEVVVPYATKIVEKIKKYRKNNPRQVIFRTIFPRFLDYIKASAVLHQHQRERNSEGKIIVTKEDYSNALIVLTKTTSNSLMIPLNNEQIKLINCVSKNFPDGETVQEINTKFTLWEERWLRINLDRLVDMGFMEKTTVGTDYSNKPVNKYKAFPELLKFSFPTYEEIMQEEEESNCSNCSMNSNSNKNENESKGIHPAKNNNANNANTTINTNDSNNAINQEE